MQRKWKRRWQRLAKTVMPPVAAGMLMLGAYGPAWAAPSGGTVTGGAATIATSGATTTVTQTTNRAAINWQSFGIAAGEAVTFVQPSASAVALNRVVGSSASNIHGRLSATGKVFLINPNGILFAPGAQVNVGGLVASTLNMADGDFMNGKYVFTKNGNAGSVVNQGTITAGDHAVLIGPQVRNEGVIAARVAALAAGDRVSLDFSGDKLLNVTVDTAAAGSSVANSGTITADGGLVVMTAGTKDALLNTVVNNSGVIRAQSVNNVNGVIRLEGNTAINSGVLDASGRAAGQTGGTVKVLGDNVTLAATAAVDVSGDAGGGTALIGGAYQGGGSEYAATNTTVEKGATINADAITSGNGGQVVVWAKDKTDFAGTITARGGAESGDGGTVEVSGKKTLVYRGRTDATAANGKRGSLLLDPSDYTIGTGATGENYWNNADLVAQLATADVTVATAAAGSGNGDIIVDAPIDFQDGTKTPTLTLNAHRDIVFNQQVTSVIGSDSYSITYGRRTLLLFGSAGRNIWINAPLTVRILDLQTARTGGGGNIYINTPELFANYKMWLKGNLTLGQNVKITVTGPGGTDGQLFIGGPLDATDPESKMVDGWVKGNGHDLTLSNGYNAAQGIKGYSVFTEFYSSINAADNVRNLNLETNNIRFYGPIALTGSLTAPTVSYYNFAGNLTSGFGVTMNGGSITTAGDQTYAGRPQLGGSGALTSTGGKITLSQGLYSPDNAAVSLQADDVTAGGIVLGGTSNIGTLTVKSKVTVGGTIESSGNQTYEKAVTLSGATTLRNKTNASGVSVTFADTVDGANIFTVNVSGSATFAKAVGAATPLTSVDLAAGGGINVNGGSVTTTSVQNYRNAVTLGADTVLTVTSGNITLSTVEGGSHTLTVKAGGSVVLNASSQIRSTAAGNAVILAAGSYFRNLAGANAINTPNGRWLVYSQNPGNAMERRDGLAYAFKQYNTAYGGEVQGTTGNGFIYTLAPTVTVGLTGTVAKTYDGTDAATLTAANYTKSGAVTAYGVTDTVNVSGGTAAYADKNAGSGKTVTVSGLTVDSATDSTGATVYGYGIANAGGSASGNVGTIDKANLTVTTGDVTKTYNGTTAAAGSAAATGGTQLYGTDTLSGGTFAFADKNAGTGKMVTVSGVTVNDGNGGNNYTVTYAANTTSTINKANLTISTGNVTKTYDATTTAAGSATATGGTQLYGADTLSGGTFAFTDKNAGTGKTVTASGVTVNDGNGGNNYTVTYAANTTSTINKRDIAVTASGQNKTYDGTTAATVTYGDNRVTGDSLTVGGAAAFADKNAGTGKAVSVSGISLGGADAGNYNLTNSTAATTADIAKRALTVAASGQNKTYDGTTAATVTYGDNRIAGDSLTVGGTAAFADKNAGSGKTVIASGISVSGADKDNYTYNATATTTADIARKAIAATGLTAENKVYDGTTAATVKTGGATLSGVIGGDAVSVAGAAGAFADKNAGTGKTVNIGGVTLSGADAGNYTATANATTADITPAALKVTADNASKTQGQTNPALTYSYSGFASGETAAVLTGGTTIATAATTTSPAGSYAINLSGTLASPNYTISYVDGVLTVRSTTTPGYTGAVGPAGQLASGGSFGGTSLGGGFGGTGAGGGFGVSGAGGGFTGGGLSGTSAGGTGAGGIVLGGLVNIAGSGVNAGGGSGFGGNTGGTGQTGQNR
ncbi:MAG: YDG domain-containing protein [Sporomusaceae bacterium]|nr:YDG domain-containing protein [Sporomusaceae bacterium]